MWNLIDLSVLPSTRATIGREHTPQHILTSGLDDYPRAQPPHQRETHIDALCWIGVKAVALKKTSAFLGEKDAEESFSKHKQDVVRSMDDIHWSEPYQAYYDTAAVDDDSMKVCHKGYLSLFPFLTNLMGSYHPHVEAVLDLIWDPEELWSPYGLRSLSLKNEQHSTDENYWRSPV